MKISFIASVPLIQSALQFGGDGSTRIKLDLPESEKSEAVKLLLFQGKAFRVTIDDGEER